MIDRLFVTLRLHDSPEHALLDFATHRNFNLIVKNVQIGLNDCLVVVGLCCSLNNSCVQIGGSLQKVATLGCQEERLYLFKIARLESLPPQMLHSGHLGVHEQLCVVLDEFVGELRMPNICSFPQKFVDQFLRKNVLVTQIVHIGALAGLIVFGVLTNADHVLKGRMGHLNGDFAVDGPISHVAVKPVCEAQLLLALQNSILHTYCLFGGLDAETEATHSC